MAKQPNRLQVSREPNEIGQDLPNYLFRLIPPLLQPVWQEGNLWRAIVRNQPAAELCQGALIDYILSLDWKIVPRDTTKQDELKSDIEYYTDLLNKGYDGLDYSEFTEWMGQDLLDLPFGFAAEIGREGDAPEGKVMWIHPLDGATMFPLPDYDWPVGQRVPGMAEPVVFPAYAVSRIYMRPRTNIEREGWGMPPPERIYLALQLLSRGDSYYAGLLLDTPTAGILDLGDMEANTAKTWLASWQALMMGIDPFKIPVLYEHTTKASFIPFGKPPTDIMYDRITLKYDAIVASGYGLTLSDIGLGGSSSGNGGETLAGTVRDERKSRKAGKAVMKRKVKSFWDKVLPKDLEYKFIDYDDEVNVAMGRARLANAQAMGLMIDKGEIDAGEGRRQMMADGIFTINMPEEPPKPPKPPSVAKPTPTPNSRDQLGRPVPPSQGGQGEITDQTTKSLASEDIRKPIQAAFDKLITNATSVRLRRLIRVAAKLQEGEVKTALNEMLYGGSEVDWEDVKALSDWYDAVLFDMEEDVPEIVKQALSAQDEVMDEAMDKDRWWETLEEDAALIGILQGLITAYQNGMSETAHQMAAYLYEIGESNSPVPDITFFNLQDEKVKSLLEKFASKIIERTNEGSRYYVRRIVMSEVRKALSRKDIASGLMDGTLTLEHIFNDDRLMDSMVIGIQAAIIDVMQSRLNIIPSGEEVTVDRMARTEMYKRAGLTKKAWRTLGPNPCTKFCIPNEKLGFVPLSHVYLASFPEGVLQPQAHANCECDLIFDKAELSEVAKEGKFRMWGGEGLGTPELTPTKVSLSNNGREDKNAKAKKN